MIHIQAPFTLCAVTSSLGAVITAFVQIITGGNLDIGSPDISIWILIAVILMVIKTRNTSLVLVIIK